MPHNDTQPVLPWALGHRRGGNTAGDDIAHVVASLLMGGRRARIHLDDFTSRTALAHFDDEHEAIVLDIPSQLAARIVGITLDGYNNAYSFATEGLRNDTSRVAFNMPQNLASHQRRTKTRRSAPADWHLCYTDTQKQSVARKLKNVSIDGMAMMAQPHDEIHFNAHVLTPITLQAGDKQVCCLLAELRNLTYDGSNTANMLIGLRVHAASKSAWEAWERAVEPVLHPTTKTDGSNFSDVWPLLERSGYFNLSDKIPSDFIAQRAAHDRFNRIIAKHPSVGIHTLWYGDGGAQANISFCTPYTHMSVLHQAARVPGAGANNMVMRDLLTRAFEYVKQQPGVQWVSALLNAKVMFHEFAFLQFARPYVAIGAAALLPFNLIEIACAGPMQSPKDLCVLPAERSDWGKLSQSVLGTRGLVYARAFDLTHDCLDAQTAKARWQQIGLERERHIVLVRDDSGQDIVAGIMDISAEGSNMFGIFDALTIVAIQPVKQSVPKNAIFALIDFARSWYRRHGRSRFVCHDFDRIFAGGCVPGTRDLGAGQIWIISKEVIADLQEYWYTCMSRSRKRVDKSMRTASTLHTR